MTKKILLTSFTTWLPHQKSNSSDDLLIEFAKSTHRNPPVATSPSLTFLRQLPVDVQQASTRAIAQIDSINPDIIICCGMAESRQQLTVESNATSAKDMIKTWVNIEQLIADLKVTEISHDAGKFVCEGLYYSILKYLRDRKLNIWCIFVHVPIITPDNMVSIKTDFSVIIDRLPLLN
ncbi:peptidase C15 [Argonema antarcticum]|uniref:pyroglutamyl-peptidase I family protein n=1 Tax=Argonema antarcticum TaxID=2942763 RepID=UPI0020127BA5|nr:peptidase C15 [Argonema antarcticum]MCL1471026.1 peptidase C15 [Argonema antarcticum A004/B2]